MARRNAYRIAPMYPHAADHRPMTQEPVRTRSCLVIVASHRHKLVSLAATIGRENLAQVGRLAVSACVMCLGGIVEVTDLAIQVVNTVHVVLQ